MENTKAKAKRKFLVFGNDRRVPELWLNDHGNLLRDVEFYFIDEEKDGDDDGEGKGEHEEGKEGGYEEGEQQEGKLEELKVVLKVGSSPRFLNTPP